MTDLSRPDPFARAQQLHRQGRLQDAYRAYDELLRHQPTHAAALHYSGLILHQSGHLAEALARLERSVTIDPSTPDAWSNLALLYHDAQRHNDALRALQRATRLAPRDPAVWENYAATLLDLGQAAEAEKAALHAAALAPRSVGAWYNAALARMELGSQVDAITAIDRALSLAPDIPAFAGLKAAIEEAQGKPGSARVVLENALARHPDDNGLSMQLATLCERTGDLVAAANAYEKLRDAPQLQGAVLSQLLFVRKRLADWHDLDALRARFRAGLAADLPMLSPFCLLSDPSTRGEQRRCAEAFVRASGTGRTSGTDAAHGVGTVRPSDARSDPGDRLTIGYLSADFHMHATALLTAGLFEHHDRKRYHVAGYSTGPDDESPLRRRLRNAFDVFVDARGWPAKRIAERIRADRVDILVDLKGHTDDARMDVLAQRPAPVQAAYLGYPGTTGAPFIDYLIGDAIVTPPEHASDYSETLVLLPVPYQVNDGAREMRLPPPREDLGLSAEAVVLCCFNQTYKIDPAVFDAWCAILRALPAAMLWLLARAKHDPAVANLRGEAQRRGVDPSRLAFATTRPNADYLGLYRHADLALDTWPYNGHTTTADALWAGCPVVTMLGSTFAGRVAASLLQAVGLPELVTSNVDGYVELVTTLARDADRRAGLRRYLEQHGRESRLFDVVATTRALERAYELMIDQRRRGIRAPVVVAGA